MALASLRDLFEGLAGSDTPDVGRRRVEATRAAAMVEVSFAQWTTRQHYVDYLAWRTETGLTDEIGDMLTEPMSIEYFDDIVSLTR